MSEQKSDDQFDVVRALINVLGFIITAGVIAIVIATIVVAA
jgi:hypothetical protein